PVLLRGVRDRARGGLTGREPVLVGGPYQRDPADPAGLLGVQFGPRVQPGQPGVPDPVLGRVHGADPRVHADHAGVLAPPRRARTGRRGRPSDRHPVTTRPRHPNGAGVAALTGSAAALTPSTFPPTLDSGQVGEGA